MNRSRDTFRYAAAILAGGQATRLGGVAKGMLDAGGASVVERLVEQLRAAGVERIMIVANDADPYRDCGLEIIGDRRPGLGPLGGIEAAVCALTGEAEATVLAPCDSPGLTAEVFGRLIGAFASGQAPGVCARTGDSIWHPLCAVVHNEIVAEVSAALDAGRRSVQDVWRSLGVQPVDFSDSDAFVNINTPADLADYQARRR